MSKQKILNLLKQIHLELQNGSQFLHTSAFLKATCIWKGMDTTNITLQVSSGTLQELSVRMKVAILLSSILRQKPNSSPTFLLQNTIGLLSAYMIISRMDNGSQYLVKKNYHVLNIVNPAQADTTFYKL